MKSPRLQWIDYAKGIAISMVCYRHVYEGSKEAGLAVHDYPFLEYANVFLYSFRMPLFFIISGLFISRSLQKRGMKLFVESRARTILYPYFVWGVLQLSIQMLFTRYTNYHPDASSYLDLLYQPRESAQFWYLAALFNVSVLYALSKYYLKLSAVHNIVIGILFFYVSSLIYQNDINGGFGTDILHYYIFFAFGDYLSSRLLDNERNQEFLQSGKLVLFTILPFLAGQAYFLLVNLRHSTPKFMHVEFYQPVAFMIIAVIGCTFIISLTFTLQKLGIFRWITILGRHSLYIYVAHVISFAATRILLTHFLGVRNVAIVIISGMTAGLLIPILLYKLAERLHMRWIFTLEKTNEFEKGNRLKDKDLASAEAIKTK